MEAREARLTRLGDELRGTSRELHRVRSQLQIVEQVIASDRTRFARDFDQLIGLPSVRGVEVDGTIVRVITEPVVIAYEGKQYRIGEFAIDIDLEHGVRVRNLANTSGSTGWEHPHVQGTVPCLGNLQEGCEILLGQFELVPLVSLLLQFLDTYHPSTAYAPISIWQEVER